MNIQIHGIRPVLQSPPVRALLYALAIALAGAGHARAATRNEAAAATHRATIDFSSCAKPAYPTADLQAGHEGTVHLSFLVTPDGKVGASKVLTSSGFAIMDEAARTALARCRFQPALADGKAVKAWTTVQYVWTLK